jgi:hypothetical protein
VLAGSFAITVTSSIPAGPPGTAVPAPTAIFEVPIGWAVALFLGLAALDHLLTATVSRSTYAHDLKAGINRFRTPPRPVQPTPAGHVQWPVIAPRPGILGPIHGVQRI